MCCKPSADYSCNKMTGAAKEGHGVYNYFLLKPGNSQKCCIISLTHKTSTRP